MTAPLVAVDLKIPSTGGSTSGCEAADFAGFPSGSIALVQRGTCNFIVKVDNATDAGAVGVVIMNEGNAPDRLGLFLPNVVGATAPVIAATFAAGDELRNGVTSGATGTTVRVKVGFLEASGTTWWGPVVEPRAAPPIAYCTGTGRIWRMGCSRL